MVKNENENNGPTSKGHSKSSSLREVYLKTVLPQETRKGSNKQFNLTPKGNEKRRTNPKVNRRKKMIKFREEINNIKTKKKERERETSNAAAVARAPAASVLHPLPLVLLH